MPNTQHFIVSGRVQGVGFRAATQETARHLELAGWVSNRHDGAVEIMASGDDKALTQFHEWLRGGPTPARVDHVEQRAADTDERLPAPFAVR